MQIEINYKKEVVRMIRKLKEKDINIVMEIWLETNISAHNFISKEYWMNNYEFVKNELPKSEIYVYEERDNIYGFIGIRNGYIEGIFVKEEHQSKGIGKKLLDYCKEKYSKLLLNVYEKNYNAIRFYNREKFKITGKKIDSTTKEVEYDMEWKRK